MRSDVSPRNLLILAFFLFFDHDSIVFRPYPSLPSQSVSAFKKCKQKIVAIETKKVIPIPYPVPMLVKPRKRPRPQTIVVTVPKPVYRKKKSCGHHYLPNHGYRCPNQQQQPILPNIPLPTSVTNSVADEVRIFPFKVLFDTMDFY